MPNDTLIWKDVLYAGRVHLPNPKDPERPHVLDITPDDVRNAISFGNRQLAQGFHVPACWEHGDGAVPLSPADLAAERTRNTFGFARRYRLADHPKHGRIAQVALDVRDTVDRDQLGKVGFVSPLVWRDWMNPKDGRKWSGMNILHVAATGSPRQPDQRPFQLSQAIEPGPNGPWQLSIDSYRSSTVPDATDTTPALETPPAAPSVPAGFTETLEILGRWGITLPVETTPANFFTAFVAAANADDAATAGANVADGTPTTAGVTMSQTPLDKAAQAQLARATTLARAGLGQRVERLLGKGRVTPPIAAKLKTEIAAANLSFDDAGELKTDLPVLIRLDAYEKLPANQAWSRQGAKLSQIPGAEAVDPPADPAEFTDKEQDDLADDIVSRTKK